MLLVLLKNLVWNELVEFGVVAAVNCEFMQLCPKIGLTDKIPGKDIV